MSADGYVVDPDQPVTVEVRCWYCSRPVYYVFPDHASCAERYASNPRNELLGVIPVQVEIQNYQVYS